METASDKTAIATIERLEYRLRRIEYILSGDDEARSVLEHATTRGKEYTTPARIARLEHALSNLSSKSPVVQDLLRLREDDWKGVIRGLANTANRRSFPGPNPARGIKGHSIIAHNLGTPRSCQLMRHTLSNHCIAIDITARLANPGRKALGFLDIVGA